MPIPPVDPYATPEARRLLAYLCSIQGQFTLSGQHNQMPRMSTVSERVQEITGHYPVVWGGEFGFSDDSYDTDNIAYRPRLMEQMRAQHAAGRILVLTYHQASPTVGEPCAFQGGVICPISEADWNEILTPGAGLNTVWAEHVDRLAEAFGELQSEGIPVIFRPYHEMNGNWFWWGGHPARFVALWNQTYERFVGHHGLHNLLWAWTCDRPWPGVEDYYPGHETVDLLGTDIYPAKDRPETYPQEWWERMARIADGRPVALSENSELPSIEVFARQPYVWFMGWDRGTFSDNSDEKLRQIFGSPAVISDRVEF